MKTEEENTFPPASSGSEQKNPGNMAIIGGNLLILLIYTIICRSNKNEGVFADALLIVIHFFICLLMIAINRKKWVTWLLSAGMVLVIGFSTCVAGWA